MFPIENRGKVNRRDTVHFKRSIFKQQWFTRDIYKRVCCITSLSQPPDQFSSMDQFSSQDKPPPPTYYKHVAHIHIMHCDRHGLHPSRSCHHMGSRQVPGHLCSSTRVTFSGCTHFAWTNYNSVACWIKRKSSVSRSEAIHHSYPGSVCGILRRLTPLSSSNAGSISSPGRSHPSSSVFWQ